MPKRFTETELWQEEWFINLPTEYKALWFYMRHHCDNSCIWRVNFTLSSFAVGTEIKKETALKLYEGEIYELDNRRWFIPKFIAEQHGSLCRTKPAHKNVIAELSREGLLDENLNIVLPTKKTSQPTKKREARNTKNDDVALKIALYYTNNIRTGAKADAERNITKLLKTVSEDVLYECMDNYILLIETKGTDMEFRIQANNFFGRQQRYKEFLPGEFNLDEMVSKPNGTFVKDFRSSAEI